MLSSSCWFSGCCEWHPASVRDLWADELSMICHCLEDNCLNVIVIPWYRNVRSISTSPTVRHLTFCLFHTAFILHTTADNLAGPILPCHLIVKLQSFGIECQMPLLKMTSNCFHLQWSCFYPCLHQASCISPWASYQIRKIAGCACAGNAGNVFPRRWIQRKLLVSDHGMHHGTCVTHVPWCMSGSLTCGDGENVPGIPGACAPAILRIWQEGHGEVPPDSTPNSKFKFKFLYCLLCTEITCWMAIDLERIK